MSEIFQAKTAPNFELNESVPSLLSLLHATPLLPVCISTAPALIEKLMEHPPIDSLNPSRSRLLEKGVYVRQPIDEGAFTASLTEDLCGTDVLGASVDGFTRDTNALEAEVAEHLQHST